MAEQQELRRHQAGVGLQIGVHAGGIGPVDRLRLGREPLEVALGDAIEAEGTQEPVGLEAGRAHHLGEARRADPALHLQLPEPVLRVDVAHGEGAVPGRLCVDVRDRMGVAHDLYRRVEAGDALAPVVGGQRDPGAGADREQHAQQHERAGAGATGPEPPEPSAPSVRDAPPHLPASGRGAHGAHDLSPSTMDVRCSSSSGAGGRTSGSR